MKEIVKVKEKRIRENIHINHRSRVKNKFIQNELTGFAEHEILELLLFYSIPQADTNPTAHRLIQEFGSLKGVFDAPLEALLSVKGVGENSAILIKLIPNIMRKYNLVQTKSRPKLNNQVNAKQYIEKIFQGSADEEFFVICLNSKSEVIDMKRMDKGTSTKVDVQIRKITDYVFKHNCSRIIIAHNHPDTTPEPSNDDIIMTQKVFNSCVLNDIDVIDHLIYSPTKIFSFAENGVMETIKKFVLNTLKYTIDSTKYQKFSALQRQQRFQHRRFPCMRPFQYPLPLK